MKRILAGTLALSIILLLLLLINGYLGSPQEQNAQEQNSQLETISIRAPNGTIYARLANTSLSRAQGIMHESCLCDNCGMLFAFSDSQIRSFWMKNTLIPLDIIFIYENFSVEGISNATPCASDPCPIYQSAHAVKYVLEINAGSSSLFGIREGTVLGIAPASQPI